MIRTTLSNGLLSHFRKVISNRVSKGLNCFNYDVALKHLEVFANKNEVPFNELNREWFNEFQLYLASAKGLRCEKPLGRNSANTYFRIVVSVAKDAADEGRIDHKNISVTPLSRRERKLSCLTNDELQCLARTPCRIPALKKAFLFSCLTGLQWKEISKLKWRQVQSVDETWIIDPQGTGSRIVPLNKQAFELLGIHGHPSELIFRLHYSAALCINLNQWALEGGVLRNITFHLARHTFGKLLLDNKVPIELVSELLGHRSIKTTRELFGIRDINPIEGRYAYLRVLNI